MALVLGRRVLRWAKGALLGLAGRLETLTAAVKTAKPGGGVGIGPREFRSAVQRMAKGLLGIVALLVLQWILGLFLRTRGYRGDMTLGDWMRLGITLGVAVAVIRMYRPVLDVATYYALASERLRRWLGDDAWAGDLAAVIGHVTLLLYVGGLYALLLPHLAHFNESVLHFRALTTILSAIVFLGALGILLMLWKSLQPAIDRLTRRIADSVSAVSGAVEQPPCPACGVGNDPGAASCSSCGGPMEVPSPGQPRPDA